MMHILYGFEVELDLFQPTTLIAAMDVHPSRKGDVINESGLHSSQPLSVETFTDCFGNTSRRVAANAGALALKLTGVLRDTGLHDLINQSAAIVPASELPIAVLPFLAASRYCETDLLSNFA
jgi:hypothetical protein